MKQHFFLHGDKVEEVNESTHVGIMLNALLIHLPILFVRCKEA